MVRPQNPWQHQSDPKGPQELGRHKFPWTGGVKAFTGASGCGATAPSPLRRHLQRRVEHGLALRLLLTWGKRGIYEFGGDLGVRGSPPGIQSPFNKTHPAPSQQPPKVTPYSPLHERHLRTLWKEPPAVLKAQRPVQSVRMRMGPRLASYHGFRKVWGHRETAHTFLSPPRAAEGVPSPVETQLKPC